MYCVVLSIFVAIEKVLVNAADISLLMYNHCQKSIRYNITFYFHQMTFQLGCGISDIQNSGTCTTTCTLVIASAQSLRTRKQAQKLQSKGKKNR
jgi:hypothetical protein